jgi:hypothetical protein
MEEHFDALAVADMLQYGKRFNATEADPIYTDHDVMAMGAGLSAHTATLKSGPLAAALRSSQRRSVTLLSAQSAPMARFIPQKCNFPA